jgi:hypothetical protein
METFTQIVLDFWKWHSESKHNNVMSCSEVKDKCGHCRKTGHTQDKCWSKPETSICTPGKSMVERTIQCFISGQKVLLCWVGHLGTLFTTFHDLIQTCDQPYKHSTVTSRSSIELLQCTELTVRITTSDLHQIWTYEQQILQWHTTLDFCSCIFPWLFWCIPLKLDAWQVPYNF